MLNEGRNPMYLADKASNFQSNTFVDHKVAPELVDIVKRYHPEILWSNTDAEASHTYWKSREFLAWLYNDSPVKDIVVVNNQWGSGTTCHYGKFCTCFSPGFKNFISCYLNLLKLDINFFRMFTSK